jgi:hypothetical protein
MFEIVATVLCRHSVPKIEIYMYKSQEPYRGIHLPLSNTKKRLTTTINKPGVQLPLPVCIGNYIFSIS